jgi:hypothetical protein
MNGGPPADGATRPSPVGAPSRSWWQVRWRQARNPPEPVLRAVLANFAVAVAGGLALLLYELAIARGVALPGGDLRSPLAVGYVALVVVAGSLLTYLWVELPGGPSGGRRRSPWAAILGFFASLPIAYLVLVLTFEVLLPLVA